MPPQTSSSKVSEFLRQLVQKRNLKVFELAEISGVAATTISSILTGDRKPGPETLQKFEAALNLTPDESRQLWDAASKVSRRVASVWELPEYKRQVEDAYELLRLVGSRFDDDPSTIVISTGDDWSIISGGIRPSKADFKAMEKLGYDFYYLCETGVVIAAKWRGLDILMARGEEGLKSLPDCEPFQIVACGGVVFRFAAITDVKDLPTELLKPFLSQSDVEEILETGEGQTSRSKRKRGIPARHRPNK